MTSFVKILFFGDFVVQNPDKISLSKNLQDLIKDSDFVSCNFEAVVSNDYKSVLKSGPTIKQSELSPNFLSKIGVNMVSIANNHIMDYGEIGLNKTRSSLGDIISIGAGSPEEAYGVKIIEIDNIKLGFLSLTQLENGALTDECDLDDIGTAWINHNSINSLITDSKKKVDFLFVIVHAGVEDIEIPLPEWRLRYKELIVLGADAIIGSHPHVPQGWEEFRGKPIFYSLGNFCFESNSDNELWNKGLYTKISLKLANNEINFIYDVGVVSFENNELCLIENNDLNNYLIDICDILKDNDKYIQSVNNAVLKLWDEVYRFYFYYYVSSLTIRFGLINFIKLLIRSILNKQNNFLLHNLMSCESHRYVISRALKLKNKYDSI